MAGDADTTIKAKTVPEALHHSKRVLWLAAHPDDETSSSALLARAKDVSGALFMASLTSGENSDELWSGLRRGTAMGKAREALFAQSAALFRADGYDVGPFTNGPHSLADLDAMPSQAPFRDWAAAATSDDVIAKWNREGDPVGYIIELLRKWRPHTVISMDDHCGVSGQDEHIAVAKLLLRAIPLAAHPDAYPREGQPWRVQHVIFSAAVIPELIACRYCKCEGRASAAPSEEVVSLEPSEIHKMTYFRVECLVSKNYQNAMESKGWTDSQIQTGCRQAESGAMRAYQNGQRGQSFSQSFRIRPLN
ncbi:MAG: PIG-L deacetylase family protein [Nitrospiraceae bacterium]